MMRAAACSRPARRGILLLVVLVKLFPPAVAHATPEDDDAVADAQRVVVTFATDTTPAEQAAALDDAGADTFCGTSSAAPRPDPYAEPAPAPAPAPTPAPTPTPAPAPAGGGFSDIAGNIATLADSGITTGCGPTTFRPDATVTRAQMASFLVRALEL